MADVYGQIAAELDKAIDMRDRYKAALESCEAVLAQRNAQLAAVKAMCHQTGGGPDAWLYVVDVLAALTGDGDRPAEPHEFDRAPTHPFRTFLHNVDLCTRIVPGRDGGIPCGQSAAHPIHSGEGDR